MPVWIAACTLSNGSCSEFTYKFTQRVLSNPGCVSLWWEEGRLPRKRGASLTALGWPLGFTEQPGLTSSSSKKISRFIGVIKGTLNLNRPKTKQIRETRQYENTDVLEQAWLNVCPSDHDYHISFIYSLLCVFLTVVLSFVDELTSITDASQCYFDTFIFRGIEE